MHGINRGVLGSCYVVLLHVSCKIGARASQKIWMSLRTCAGASCRLDLRWALPQSLKFSSLRGCAKSPERAIQMVQFHARNDEQVTPGGAV